jgi:hypothetical protein
MSGTCGRVTTSDASCRCKSNPVVPWIWRELPGRDAARSISSLGLHGGRQMGLPGRGGVRFPVAPRTFWCMVGDASKRPPRHPSRAGPARRSVGRTSP